MMVFGRGIGAAACLGDPSVTNTHCSVSAMPNTKSAKKRLKQDARRRDKNRSEKRALRTERKKVLAAVAAGDAAKAETELRLAAKMLDQAAAKHVIHRNASARVKSRLSARVKALKSQ